MLCIMRYLSFILLVLSIKLFHKSYAGKGYHNKCVLNDTAHTERYERVFVFAGEFRTFIVHKEPWPQTADELHKLAGRRTKSQVIEEGRKALKYFMDKYGINVSHLITDEQIYNGVDVPFSDFTFVHEAVDLIPGTYRLIMESKGNKSHYYTNPPVVNEVAFVFVIHKEFNAGGTFNEMLFPGDVLLYGDYIIQSSRRCSFDRLVIIHNEGLGPIKPHGKSSIVTNEDYGSGLSQVSFLKGVDGITRAINVLRFPAK